MTDRQKVQNFTKHLLLMEMKTRPTIHRATDQDRLSLFEILSGVAIILFALLWIFLLT